MLVTQVEPLFETFLLPDKLFIINEHYDGSWRLHFQISFIMLLMLKPFIIPGGPNIVRHGCHQQLQHRLCSGALPHSEPRKPRRKRLCLPAEHQRSPGNGLPGSQRRHGISDGSGQTQHYVAAHCIPSFTSISSVTQYKWSYKSANVFVRFFNLRALLTQINKMTSLAWNCASV